MKRPPVRYFRLNLGRMTVGEIWRVCEGNILAFLIVLPSKIGIRLITPPHAIPLKTQSILIDPDDIPRNAMKRLRASINHFEKVGFSVISYGETPLLEPEREQFSVLLRAENGHVIAGSVDIRQPIKTVTFTALVSRYQDGSYFVTSNEPRIFDHIPGRTVHYFPGMSADRLYVEHLERLEQADAEGMLVVPFTPSDCITTSINFGITENKYFVERGVLVEIPDEEVEDIFWRRSQDHADDDDFD